MERLGDDDLEAVVGETGDRDVGHHTAALVHPLGVDAAARRHGHVVARQAVQQRLGVGALHEELRHRRHVEQGHVVAHRVVLGGVVPEPVGAAVRVAELDGGIRRSEVGRVLPAGGLREPGAGGHEAVVERGPPNVSCRRRLRVRPRSRRVQPPEQLDAALGEIRPARLPALEAGDVDAGDVDRRRAVDDPVRDDRSGAAAGEDAERVEAGGDEEPVEFGRLAHQEAVVGGEALRSGEQLADADVGEARQDLHRVLEERCEPVPVGRDLAEAEVVGDPIDRPRRGDRLEEADHEPAGLLAVVGEPVGVLEDRQVGRHPLERLGDQVGVLDRLERHRHPGHRPDLAGPHAGAVDDVLGLDRSVLGDHAGHPAGALRDAGDRRTLHDPHPERTGAGGERHRHVVGVGPTLARGEEPADHVGRVDVRPEIGHLSRGDLLAVDAHQPEEIGLPTELVHALGIARGLQVADRLEAGREPGLVLERRVEVGRVLRHPGERLGGHAARHDQPGRVPRGARGELVAFEEDDVGPAEMCEVIGDAGADHATADDHDPGGVRHCPRRGARMSCRRRRFHAPILAGRVVRSTDGERAQPRWSVAYSST